MKIALGIAALMFLSASVAYAASDFLNITGSTQLNSGYLTKITDSKSRVDCYAYKDLTNIALSCVKQ